MVLTDSNPGLMTSLHAASEANRLLACNREIEYSSRPTSSNFDLSGVVTIAS